MMAGASDPGNDLDCILLQLREILNKEKVKLWLSPFTTSDESTEPVTAMKELAQRYSAELNVDYQLCLRALISLQKKALERLNARSTANIDVRVCGKQKRTLKLTFPLTRTTDELQELIAKDSGVSPERIKIIASGKVLKSGLTLEEQGVLNGFHLLAVHVENTSSVEAQDPYIREVLQIKSDLQVLSSRSASDSDVFVQIIDQNGKTLDLAVKEKETLTLAMILHEKGRTALKKEDYGLALVLLLEADKQFSLCRSDLLRCADNYAILNLDIAWCYLCLRSVTHMNDAEYRLKKCEMFFHKSYGRSLERLLAVRGTSGVEAALFMRLHLLQGILAFHRGLTDDAKQMLEKAETELNTLRVSDNNIATLVELGLSIEEARLGLRATYGSLDGALDYIFKRRTAREQAFKEDREKFLQEKRKKRYGKTSNESWVDPEKVDRLKMRGFKKSNVIQAIKDCDNDFDKALQQLEMSESSDAEKEFRINLRMLMDNGFSCWQGKYALENCNNDPDAALNFLLNNDQEMSEPESDDDIGARAESTEEVNEAEYKEALSRVSDGVTENADDHFDLTLEQEEIFLREYLALIN